MPNSCPWNNLVSCNESHQDNKRKPFQKIDKKLTWDELVHVRMFSAHVMELKATYPRKYPYKHGRSDEGEHQQSLGHGTAPLPHCN